MKKVSVAFQGGGARVFDLIAAANALETLNRDGVLHVKRVSGTSAGAIAAATYAFGARYSTIAASGTKISKLISKYLPQGNLARPNILWSVLRNKPLYPERNVISLVTEIFDLLDVDSRKPIRDCIKTDAARCEEIRIMASRLDSASPWQFTESSDLELNRALVDSAGLPFVFKLPGQGRNSLNPHLVDGGLFQNLPGEAATADLDEDIIPIAIRFPDIGNIDIETKTPMSYLSYVLGRMIDARTNEASLLFEDHRIVTINSALDTLSFDRIIGRDFEKAYDETYKSALVGIEKSLKSEDNSKKNYYDNTPKSLVNLYRTFQKDVKEFSEKSDELHLYEAQEVRLIYHVHSLIDENIPDTVKTIFKIDGTKNKRNGIQFQYLPILFHNTDKCTVAPPIVKATFYDAGEDGHSSTNVEDIPVLTLPLHTPDPDYQKMILMLQRPVPEGRMATISQCEQCMVVLNELKEYGKDFIYFVTSDDQIVHRMVFELHLPDADRNGNSYTFSIRALSEQFEQGIIKTYAPNPDLRPTPTLEPAQPVSGLLRKHEVVFEAKDSEQPHPEGSVFIIAVERV